MLRRVAALFCLSAFLGGFGAAAQERGYPQGSPGTIVVKVRSALGGPLPGSALVRLNAPVTALNFSSPTSEGAQVQFTGLPVGDYTVEVTAAGFDRAEERTEVVPGMTVTVFVTMRPEGSGALSPPPSGTILTPKAAKELDKGVAAMNSGDLKEAREKFEKVLRMAPGHPEAYFLLAVVNYRETELAAAEERLKRALNLNPKHAGANSLLGRILMQRNEIPEAIRAFERALAEDPSVWESHAMLANAYMASKQPALAKEHATRALGLSPGQMPQLRLLAAQASVELGDLSGANRLIEEFLAGYPNHAAVPAAEALLAKLRPAASDPNLTAASPATSTPATPIEPPAIPKVPEGNWAPKDVDERKPYVARDVTCSLPHVMKNAGGRVTQLAESLQGISANEMVEHAELDENGVAKSVLSKQFNYMVSIGKVRGGLLSVEEMRDGRQGYDRFPTQMVTRGLAAMALILYPEYAKDLEFRCEGLGQWKGRSVWQLYFKQRADRENRIRSYHTRAGRFPVALKGRLWIDANSYQIVRIETDLVEPIKQAELAREHITVEYKPYQFKQRKLQLWLPERAEMFTKLSGKRYRHRHTFGDYTYFSVDTRQKISDPKTTHPPEQ